MQWGCGPRAADIREKATLGALATESPGGKAPPPRSRARRSPAWLAASLPPQPPQPRRKRTQPPPGSPHSFCSPHRPLRVRQPPHTRVLDTEGGPARGARQGREKRRPFEGGPWWDSWRPPRSVLCPPGFRTELRTPPHTRRVPTGAVASAPAWAGGFPRPGDLEGQRSTPQARGFRSRAASPSSQPLRPRPLSLVALSRPAPDPGRGRGGESTEGLTHVLRTRAPRGPPWALQQSEIAKSSLGNVGGEAWEEGEENK